MEQSGLEFCQWLYPDLKKQQQNTLTVSPGFDELTIEDLTLHQCYERQCLAAVNRPKNTNLTHPRLARYVS
jgi:hypothetical protein